MKKQFKSVFAIIIASLAMLAMILDAKTALSGASEGLELCIKVVIPSLFPFMILSMVLTTLLSKLSFSNQYLSSRFLHLSPQGIKLFVLGLLGGYPVGAQCIAQAYQSRMIRRSEAERMLAFCNNAGPAFIFGIGLRLLDQVWMCWIVWLIHILGSCITGILTPPMDIQDHSIISSGIAPPKISIIQRGIEAISSVCGWIILFRVILAFFERWILWLLPKPLDIIISGILELANGSIDLTNIASPGIRFIIFSAILGFGGLCVMLQTKTVLSGSVLNGYLYFPGKMVHASISYLLSFLVATLIFEENLMNSNWALLISALLICIGYRISFAKKKNGMDFYFKSLYNEKKSWRLYP